MESPILAQLAVYNHKYCIVLIQRMMCAALSGRMINVQLTTCFAD